MFSVNVQCYCYHQNSVMLASLRMENDRYKNIAKFVEDEVCVQRELKESFNNINMKEVHKLAGKIRHLNI